MEKTDEENLAQYISATRIRFEKDITILCCIIPLCRNDFNQDIPIAATNGKNNLQSQYLF